MMQNAPMNKFWGPLFDYFMDIIIFMIWESVDDDDSPGYPPPPIPTRPGKTDVVRLDPH